MDYILYSDGLTKQYGKQKAVDRVSIHVRQGDIYGLIGRNGAGKTTLLKMISGLARPTGGDFAVFGRRGAEREQVLGRIGVLIEQPGVYPEMTAADNIRMKGISMGVRGEEYVTDLLERVGLEQTGRKKVKKFSMGMKQRLGIALALVGNPDLVILDEPINGLDPQGIAEVRETLSRLNREENITFLISSHILEELSKLATSYGIIHGGTLLKEMSREQLLEECSERLELRTDNNKIACTILEQMGIGNYKVVDRDTIHIYERLDEGGEITMALSRQEIRVLEITKKNEALEDYFLNLTGGVSHV